jgi:hypothetical protein
MDAYILAGYATTYQRLERHSYEDHAKAKALSIFLAKATLDTPRLDRATVEAVLAAHQSWPHSPGASSFEGVNLPLSLLEEHGLVAFYGGWCTVHCQSLRNPGNVNQTLIPLIRALEHLKDICYGRNGYIQPYYAYPENELEKLLEAHFGRASVPELLPELILEDGYFKLPPDNQHFDSLVSTYLWQTLRETLEPKEAFEHWILCLRVNCTWAMPVLFDDGDFEQRTEFNEQLLAYIAQDAGLSLPMDWLWKQAINESNFSGIIMPIETRINLTIGLDGNSRSEHQDIELEETTLANLSAAYSLPSGDDSSNLKFVQKWRQSGHWQEPRLFYISLLASAIEGNIRIDGQLLMSHGFTEKLLELAASRPILKHVLFNLLSERGNFTYKIFLLSQPDTCDIALFYLTQQSFSSPRRDSHSLTQHFDKGFQQLVCHEYLRAIEVEADGGDRLLKVVEFMGERCELHARDFSESYEYQFLLCLLESLDPQRVAQLGQAFSQRPARTEKTLGYHSQQHYWYLLGFWLIERLESVGIDQSGTISHSLKTALLNHYKTEFQENLAGTRRSLEPNYFFSALPWHKFIGNGGIGEFLTLSNRCGDWLMKLSYSNESKFAVASAVKNYLQVLMCLGRPQRISKDWERVANRVLEIVRTLGFGPREKATHLFDEAFYQNKFDLWPIFCSYTNLFQDSLYDDFIERCLPLIPLNQLFVLLERCTVIARTQKLQGAIADRQLSETEDLGLSGLEQAFTSACDAGHTAFATKLLDSAKVILAQDRFAKATSYHFLRLRKVWDSYEYKLQLISLLETSRHNSENFAEAARKVQIPHELHGNSSQEDRVQWQECERFKRYIVAASYCETEPERCVATMEVLYKETQYTHHSFMLFKGRIASHRSKPNTTELRHALSQFLGSLDSMEPELMPTTWIAAILDNYRQLQDSPKIDDFWMKLNQDQQARREILHPYCLALIARGDALIAQKIINCYRELNQQASDALGINDLMDELGRNLPPQLSMSQLIQVEREELQRSTAQLTNHYSQIVSKNFEDYVAIVGQGQSPEEFLKSAVLEVAQELLLRKKNIQLHQEDSHGVMSFRITKEDLINDWFTSLFDKRMAEARVGFRDQKRGGQSVSGKSPGEIDGYITDAKNKRLSIFEAFRIFSLDTTVISEHLNKIAGYDKESLSPVFVVAYCAVSDFDNLVRDYAKFIATQDYVGFTAESVTGRRVETQQDANHLWLGMEQRRRGNREIIFYHLLLNMGS